MNREIKFRVYDYDMKKMRYLDEEHDFICFSAKDNGYYHNMQTGLGEWFSKLMQYTGLKDKNGVEIYEGDIVEYNYIGEDEETARHYPKKGVINFKDNGWHINNKWLDGYTMRMFKFEVIGNIYEVDYSTTLNHNGHYGAGLLFNSTSIVFMSRKNENRACESQCTSREAYNQYSQKKWYKRILNKYSI